MNTAPRELRLPAFRELQELRRLLAHAPLIRDTPEHEARTVSFRVLKDLCALLSAFKKRIEAGERCIIVEIPHPHKDGRLRVEFSIEPSQ